MVRGMKFRIQEEEGLFYLCSENKAAISCMDTTQLICAFFANAKNRFSHEAAHILYASDKLYHQVHCEDFIRLGRCPGCTMFSLYVFTT